MKRSVLLVFLSAVLSFNPLARAAVLGGPAGAPKPMFAGMSKPWAKVLLEFKRPSADLRARHSEVFDLLDKVHFAPIVSVLVKENYTYDRFAGLKPLEQAALVHRLLSKASAEVKRASEEAMIIAAAEGIPLAERRQAHDNLNKILRRYAGFLDADAVKTLESVEALVRIKIPEGTGSQVQARAGETASALSPSAQAQAASPAPSEIPGRQAIRQLEKLKKSSLAHPRGDMDTILRLEEAAASSPNSALQRMVLRGLTLHMLADEATAVSAAQSIERIAEKSSHESVQLLAVESLMKSALAGDESTARGLIAAVERLAASSPHAGVKQAAVSLLLEDRNNLRRLPQYRSALKGALARLGPAAKLPAPKAAATPARSGMRFYSTDDPAPSKMEFREVPVVKEAVERIQKGLASHPFAAALAFSLTTLLAGFLLAQSFPAAGLLLLLGAITAAGLAGFAAQHPYAAVLQTAMVAQFYALVSAFGHVHGSHHAPGLIVAGLAWSGISLWSYRRGHPFVGLILNALALGILTVVQLLV